MDGYLEIKTKIDNSSVDKDIQVLEDKIKKMQLDNSNLSKQQSSLQATIDKYKELTQKVEKYKKQMESLQYIDNKGQVQVTDKNKMLNLQAMYSIANNELQKQALQIDKVYAKLDKVKTKQTENNAKISQFKDKIEAIRADKIHSSLNSVGKSIQSQIGKIGKMAMAVVGIRTAWNAVRSAINTVQQYNPQISADFEYMRFCIANMLAPAVQWLTKLLYSLLSYVNAIASAWFGINLFGNSSVKAFQKMQKSAGGTAKSAKEIQKSLQGFDEMNVLQDSNTSSGRGTGGTVAPSMDLSGIQGEVPAWLQWIIDNKDIVLAILVAIGTALLGIKILDFANKLKILSPLLTGVFKSFKNIASGLPSVGAGITIAIAGFVLMAKNVWELIMGWDQLSAKEKILKITFAAIGVAAIALGYAIATGLSVATLGIGALIAAVMTALTVIVSFIAKLATEEGAILSVADAQKNLEEATKSAKEANESYIDSVDKAEKTLNTLREAEKKAGITGEELYKQVEQGTLDYKDMTSEQRAVYKAYLDNENAQKQLKEATNTLTEAKKKEKIASWESKLATMAEAGQYDEYKKSVVDAFKNGELSAEEARDLIGKSMSGMSRDSQKAFMEDLPSDIKNGLDPKNYETAGQKISKWFAGLWDGIKNVFTNIGQKIGEAVSKAFRSAVNAVLSTIERVLNTPIRAINSLIGVINMVPGINLGKLSTFNLPRLAKGGIISQPTQAIIGEAGKEAVVPLENNMEWLDILADKLANKIGSGNGSYIIQLDGRTVQRGIARRNQELAFAKNGR